MKHNQFKRIPQLYNSIRPQRRWIVVYKEPRVAGELTRISYKTVSAPTALDAANVFSGREIVDVIAL